MNNYYKMMTFFMMVLCATVTFGQYLDSAGNETSINPTYSGFNLSPNSNTIASGLSNPQGIAIVNNEAFITNRGAGQIVKIDLTNPGAPFEVVTTGYSTPIGIAAIGNMVYFVDGTNGGSLYSFDSTLANPPVTVLATNIGGFSQQMVAQGNTLYFTPDNTIKSFDTTNPGAGVNTLYTGIGSNITFGIEVSGNTLYFSRFINNAHPLYSLDLNNLSAPEQLLGTFSESISSIVAQDDNLLVSDDFGNTISQIDLSQSPATSTIFETNTQGGIALERYNNDLIFATFSAGTIEIIEDVFQSNNTNTGSILIAAADLLPGLVDVENKIEANSNYTVELFDATTATPTLAQLQAYDVVWIWSNFAYSNPVDFGNILAAYVDGGGRVLDTTFNGQNGNNSVSGNFTQYMLYTNANFTGSFPNLNIDEILVPGHPTLNNITSYNGGTSSFHLLNGTITTGATVIAEYVNDAPFLIVQENVGPANVRRAFINMYAPSSDVRVDYWDVSTQGTQIMINTIDWLLENSAANTPPTAVCENITVQLDATGNATITAADVDGGSTDADGTITLSIDVATFNCSMIGANNVVLTVTDNQGATATCTAIVTVQDTEAPVIDNCPVQISQANDAGSCDAVVTFATPTVTDNCIAGVTLTQTAGLPSGSAFPVGTTTVTFEAEDASGNITTCSINVVVIDAEAPVVNCETTITQPNDAGSCDAVVTFAIPTVTDNCTAGTTITQTAGLPSGSTFPVGTTTITYEAEDASGNTTTCSFDVVVIDAEAPVINCPQDLTVMVAEGETYTVPDYIDNGDVTITDNCSVTLGSVQSITPGDTLSAGVYTIEIEAVDDEGNVASCTFELTVSEILGTSDQAINEFTLYPNPANTQISINGNFNIATVDVFNLQGQKVLSSTSQVLQVESLSSAMYLITVTDTEGNSATKRFVKK